jgi:hypothetical protein
MSELTCPVCLSVGVERGRSQDYGERQQYDCPRCGTFTVTGLALAALSGRFSAKPELRQRVSHQLRKLADVGPPAIANTSNLEDLLAAPLPTRQEHTVLLLHFIERSLGNDHYGSVNLGLVRNLPLRLKHGRA